MSPQTRETAEIEFIPLVSNPTTFLGGGGEANYSNLEWLLQARLISHFLKKSNIVHALWLAERRVCMGVCKHGWDVKMFCFSRANQATPNLKTFSSWKLHKFTLFTHSLVGWNLENLSKTCFVNFFRLSWHFKREKSVLWKASFLQNKNWLREQDVVLCTRLHDWCEFLF